MDIINDFILQAVGSPWILPILFAITAIDGFFPPVPSETVLVAAAAVAGSTGGTGGGAGIALLCVVGALGAMAGDNIAYGIGRAVGAERWAWMRRPRVAASFAMARRTLARGGAGLILGARYVPVGRVAVNMTAGAVHYPWRRFVLLSAAGGAVWAAYSVGIGLLAGQWLQGQPVLSAVIGVAGALLVGVIVDRFSSRRRRAALAREACGEVAVSAEHAESAVTDPVMR